MKSFDSEISEQELKLLTEKANKWIKSTSGTIELDFDNEVNLFQSVLDNITFHKLVGIDLILDKIFNEIGFNRIEDELKSIKNLSDDLEKKNLNYPLKKLLKYFRVFIK